MNIGASLKARLQEALQLARNCVAAHRELLAKRTACKHGTNTTALDAEIQRVQADWQRQINKCNALRQMLADYSIGEWGGSEEVKTR